MESVSNQAGRTLNLLEAAFCVSLVAEKFVAAFARELRRLGHDSLGDELGSMLLADCWEYKTGGNEINDESVERLLNNAQHRLRRTLRGPRAKRTWQLGASSDALQARDADPTAAVEFEDLVSKILSQLSPFETLLLSLKVEGASPDAIAELLGLSRSTVFRRLDDLKSKLGGKL